MAPYGKATPALVKWWKAYVPIYGQVTRTVSPFRQNIVTPYFKHIPHSWPKKITDNIMDVGPAALLLAGIVYWSDTAYEADQKSHRY